MKTLQPLLDVIQELLNNAAAVDSVFLHPGDPRLPGPLPWLAISTETYSKLWNAAAAVRNELDDEHTP